MCLSLTFNTETKTCLLFAQNKESSNQTLVHYFPAIHYQRLFYRGGAVVDEVGSCCFSLVIYAVNLAQGFQT